MLTGSPSVSGGLSQGQSVVYVYAPQKGPLLDGKSLPNRLMTFRGTNNYLSFFIPDDNVRVIRKLLT
jgi:hypothetical protein